MRKLLASGGIKDETGHVRTFNGVTTNLPHKAWLILYNMIKSLCATPGGLFPFISMTKIFQFPNRKIGNVIIPKKVSK